MSPELENLAYQSDINQSAPSATRNSSMWTEPIAVIGMACKYLGASDIGGTAAAAHALSMDRELFTGFHPVLFVAETAPSGQSPTMPLQKTPIESATVV